MHKEKLTYFQEINFLRCARRGIVIANPNSALERFRARRATMANERTCTTENSDKWSRIGNRAGFENPLLPERIHIHYNRTINLQAYDRRRRGWSYLPCKTLDLSPDDGFSMLSAHRKPVSIVHKVNLHEEIPGKVRETRVRSERKDNKPVEANPNEDYDIRGMWARI